MTAPAFAGEHLCICSRWVHEHDGTSIYCPEGCLGHLPPLCCPDCPCGSFREAHPVGGAQAESGPE